MSPSDIETGREYYVHCFNKYEVSVARVVYVCGSDCIIGLSGLYRIPCADVIGPVPPRPAPAWQFWRRDKTTPAATNAAPAMTEQEYQRHSEAAASADRIINKLFGPTAMTEQADQPAEGTCATCRWWREYHGDLEGSGGGQCHRYPPDHIEGFPQSEHDWFCGEHEPTTLGGDDATLHKT